MILVWMLTHSQPVHVARSVGCRAAGLLHAGYNGSPERLVCHKNGGGDFAAQFHAILRPGIPYGPHSGL